MRHKEGKGFSVEFSSAHYCIKRHDCCVLLETEYTVASCDKETVTEKKPQNQSKMRSLFIVLRRRDFPASKTTD